MSCACVVPRAPPRAAAARPAGAVLGCWRYICTPAYASSLGSPSAPTAGGVRTTRGGMALDTHLVFGGYQRWACTIFFVALICCETTFGTTLQFLLLKVSGKYGLRDSQSGLYPVAQGVGQLLGSMVFGRLADVWGRRPVILASLSATVLGAALCSMVPEHVDVVMGVPCYALLMLALALLGFGFGGSLSPLCILLAEILPMHRRGFYLATATVAFQVGSVLVAAAAWYVMPRSLYGGDHVGSSSGSAQPTGAAFVVVGFTGWRLLYAAEGIVALLCVCLLFVILPESPRFLLLRHRPQDIERLRLQLQTMLDMGGLQLHSVPSARATAPVAALSPHQQQHQQQQQPLLTMAVNSGSTDDTPQFATVQDLIAALAAEETAARASSHTKHVDVGVTGRWTVLLQGKLLTITLLTTTVWGCFQFSNGFSNYLPTLLEQRGVSRSSLYPSLLLNAVAGVPGKVGGGVLIECFGRRRTISGSIAVTGFCLLGFAFFESPALLVLLSSGVTCMLSLCVGALNVYTTEAFPTEARSTGLAINNVSRSLIGLGGPYFCGLYATTDPQLALDVFAAAAGVGSIAAFMLPYETKGQQLADRA